jgi:hypothetical protein
MPQIKSILCPVDFSEFSVYAYEYAQSLAWHYKAALFLQHVLYPFYSNFAGFWQWYQLLMKSAVSNFALMVSRNFRNLRHATNELGFGLNAWSRMVG